MDSTKRGPMTRMQPNHPAKLHRPHILPGALLLAAFVLLALLAFPARAAVRFDMFVGYDGIVPVGSWFPVSFEVQNDGPPFTATVEIAPGQFSSTHNRTMLVELPTGTTKRFLIPTFNAGSYNPTWNARVLDERGKVRAETTSQRVRRLNDAVIPLAAALSRVLPPLPELKARNEDVRPVIGRLQPAVFPDNPLALEGLDTLYLSSERALELKANQVGPLLAWLHGGGHLVVGLEQINHLSGPGEWLKQLLPIEPSGMKTVTAHPDVQSWLASRKRFDGSDYDPALAKKSSSGNASQSSVNPYATLLADPQFEAAPIQTVTGRLRDGRVLLGTEAEPLAITATRGRGTLTTLLFAPEIEPFRSWKNTPHFWAKMIDLPPELLANDNFNRYGGRPIDGVFGAMIDSKQIRKLPVGWLLLLLLGYLAVIGPLDQFWLKKLNKQMLTWLTFPAYVAFFSLLIYFIGYKLRAGETEWNELHIVDVMPHGDRADLRGRSYGSIYSPVNARYDFASEEVFATLRGEYAGNYGGGQDSSRATVEQLPAGFRAQASVPVWTSQMFVSDWWRQDDVPVRFTVTAKEIIIDNELDVPLTGLRVVIGKRVYDLPDVPAQEKKTVDRRGQAGTELPSFVEMHARHFSTVVGNRQRAFGGNENETTSIKDHASASIAASLISFSKAANNYEEFTCPPGFELTEVAGRGHAILFAWLPDHSFTKPLNKFPAKRGSKNTLLRVAAEISK